MKTLAPTLVLVSTLALAGLSSTAIAKTATTSPNTAPAAAAEKTEHRHLSGTIVSIDAQARTVKLKVGKAGTEETFHLTPSATVMKGGKEVSLDVVKAGERVTARKDGDQLAALSVQRK